MRVICLLRGAVWMKNYMTQNTQVRNCYLDSEKMGWIQIHLYFLG